jgi:hypothetical protein
MWRKIWKFWQNFLASKRCLSWSEQDCSKITFQTMALPNPFRFTSNDYVIKCWVSHGHRWQVPRPSAGCACDNRPTSRAELRTAPPCRNRQRQLCFWSVEVRGCLLSSCGHWLPVKAAGRYDPRWLGLLLLSCSATPWLCELVCHPGPKATLHVSRNCHADELQGWPGPGAMMDGHGRAAVSSVY